MMYGICCVVHDVQHTHPTHCLVFQVTTSFSPGRLLSLPQTTASSPNCVHILHVSRNGSTR
ncbi:hypothetical protein EON63_24145 [archaeon]|nr:MAG: hypothetical protein EON63_24145 [archaeon]